MRFTSKSPASDNEVSDIVPFYIGIVKELKEKRAGLYAQIDALRKETDGREMTAEEQQRWDTLFADYDKADILAFHIPAVSSPAGKVEVIGSRQGVAHDFNLNGDAYRANDWGREGILVTDGEGQQHIETPWLHSDIKNMAYYYVYPAFTNIVEKGAMK